MNTAAESTNTAHAKKGYLTGIGGISKPTKRANGSGEGVLERLVERKCLAVQWVVLQRVHHAVRTVSKVHP